MQYNRASDSSSQLDYARVISTPIIIIIIIKTLQFILMVQYVQVLHILFLTSK